MKGIKIFQCPCGAVFQQSHYNYHVKTSKQHKEYEINETTNIIENYFLPPKENDNETWIIIEKNNIEI